jgi:hypothetical protein
MPQRRPRHRALSALVCSLVLLASGDDFNLARVVLPLPAPAPEAPLPLDDPNTDFTEGPQAQEQAPAGRAPREGQAAAARGPARAAVAPPARTHSTRNSTNSPLRC